jgi:hypothetical protein
MEESKSTTCEHSSELIDFLYGELNGSESRTFQRHLQDCNSCSVDLAAFENIHSSMVAWRDDSLGRIASLPRSTATLAPSSRPSALAALREFFNLSPLWMKGAVAFASLLFVLLGGLAVARLNDGSTKTAVTLPVAVNNAPYSEQQLNALVERRVQDELQRLKPSTNQTATTQPVSAHAAGSNSVRRLATRSEVVAASAPTRRPLSKVERQQLAADLRLVAVNSDSDLDLLDDRINQ